MRKGSAKHGRGGRHAYQRNVDKPDKRRPAESQSEQGSPKLVTEGDDLRTPAIGTPPAAAITTVVEDHPADPTGAPERRVVSDVDKPATSLTPIGGTAAQREPQEHRGKEKEHRELIAPKIPSPAVQQANQTTAVEAATKGLKSQVAVPQPSAKPLALEKHRSRRQRSLKPRVGTKSAPGASPTSAGSPADVRNGHDAGARNVPGDRPSEVGAPSLRSSPLRVPAGEKEPQQGPSVQYLLGMSPDATSAGPAGPPSKVPSPTRSPPEGGKRSHDESITHAKRASPKSANLNAMAAAELLASYEKLKDMAKSRTPETVMTKTGFTKTTLTKTLITGKAGWPTVAMTLGICALFLGTLLLLAVRRSFRPLRLCRAEDCQSHATLLTDRLNTTLDPCDDFRAFVCSAWQMSRKHSEQSRSVIDDLRFTWFNRFEDTLTMGALKFSAGRKPLAMYRMCKRYFPSNGSQVELIRNFFDRFRFRWPQTPEEIIPPLVLLVVLSYQWQSPYWITVHLLEPSATGRQRVLVTPGIYVPMLRNQHRSVEEAYDRYWQLYLELFYPDPSTRPTSNEEAIREIRDMEGDVLDSLHAAAESPRKRPAKFTFDEIDTHVPNASGAIWVDAFQTGMLLHPSLTVDDEIVTTDVAFLSVVAELLVKYDALMLNRHLVWLIMQYYAPVTDYAFLVGYYGSNEKAAAYMPAFCAHEVETSYKVLVLALGVVTRLPVHDRRVINAGFQSLVSAAFAKIRDSIWIDEKDKIRMITKFAAIKMDFLPPDTLLDDIVLKRLYAGFPEEEPSLAHYWFKSVAAMQEMNRIPEYNKALLLPRNNFLNYAGYGYFSNTVRLAIGAAAAPAYYGNGTKGMLYGGLLFLLAMQMVRAIDDEGIRWAPNNTALTDTMLSNASLQAFHQRAACRYGAGNESAFPEVPALEIAYSALVESHIVDKTEPLALGEQLPEDKVFFMTLCYMTCDSTSIAADCNKAVRNFDAFARVYSCPKGSKMNPENKCSFFV
ncbi:endothelin-converting enzyme 2-like isoform X2 [Dermacentor variabilis]